MMGKRERIGVRGYANIYVFFVGLYNIALSGIVTGMKHLRRLKTRQS